MMAVPANVSQPTTACVKRQNMLASNIYTVLHIPTAISFPSPRCLQWSSDGQLMFITKSAVYILTPDHGINFDNESLIKSSGPKATDSQAFIGWFRTMVQDNKLMDGTRWPDVSQAWGVVSLGSIDASIMAVECSPSGITRDGQSLLALMTSNMDISLWKAGNNYLKGKWQKISDITPFLLSYFTTETSGLPSTARTLQSQSTCMCWTSQPNFGLLPHPPIPGSLLVIGNRGGSLSFLRYTSKGMQILTAHSVANTWVSHVATSSWISTSPGKCKSYLAFGTADGAVGLVNLKEILTPQESAFSFILDQEIGISVERAEEPILASDRTGITALKWISTRTGACILVICKPGIIYLWSPSSGDGIAWHGLRCLELVRQRVSSAASPYHPASGITYISFEDALIVSLFDGSINVIHGLGTEPRWKPPTEDSQLDSAALSENCRSIIAKVESGSVDQKVMKRIKGLSSYDFGFSFVWTHESFIPSDFSYKHDAKHSSTIVVAQLGKMSADSKFLEQLQRVLSEKNGAPHPVSLRVLRPFFFGLRNQGRLDALHQDLLKILQVSSEDYSLKISIPRLEVPITAEIRKTFRTSLATHLFGWPGTSSLRMQLSLADFLWKFSENESRRTDCGEAAQGILNSISQRTLRTLLRHVAAVVGGLRSSDIPFVLRLVIQSLLPGSPADLTAEGQALSLTTEGLLISDPTSAALDEFTELCPACHVTIPFQDINSAVCTNGHYWPRCSITTFILSTPWVRTCVGCSRKALLPPSASLANTGVVELPRLAQGWIVSDLLETVHQCLFCNNSFVSLL